MTPRLHAVQARDLVRARERDGRVQVAQRGSHLKLRKPGMAPVIVPMHRRDVPKGTLASILADAEISAERFLELHRS